MSSLNKSSVCTGTLCVASRSLSRRMAASPSACSCSRICPPLGRDTCTTSTSADRRRARSASGSATFLAAQGLLTATRIRLMRHTLRERTLIHQRAQLPQRLPPVTDPVLLLRRQLGRSLSQLVDQEKRVVSKTAFSAWFPKDSTFNRIFRRQ